MESYLTSHDGQTEVIYFSLVPEELLMVICRRMDTSIFKSFITAFPEIPDAFYEKLFIFVNSVLYRKVKILQYQPQRYSWLNLYYNYVLLEREDNLASKYEIYKIKEIIPGSEILINNKHILTVYREANISKDWYIKSDFTKDKDLRSFIANMIKDLQEGISKEIFDKLTKILIESDMVDVKNLESRKWLHEYACSENVTPVKKFGYLIYYYIINLQCMIGNFFNIFRTFKKKGRLLCM